ncbi:MAG: sugar phosphate isomerase/epimerase family protein, partial [Armatimonadota bacterium]
VLGCGHEADERARRDKYAMIRNVADYAAPRGIRIALEIHGGIMANADEALRTMDEVDRDNVGVNFDTANILFYNDDLDAAGAVAELDRLADRVFHVHLKDIIRGKTQAEHVLPRLGQGEVDFRKVFDVLHAADFRGPFSFEVETFHGATAADDITPYHEDLLASIDYIRSLNEFDA